MSLKSSAKIIDHQNSLTHRYILEILEKYQSSLQFYQLHLIADSGIIHITIYKVAFCLIILLNGLFDYILYFANKLCFQMHFL